MSLIWWKQYITVVLCSADVSKIWAQLFKHDVTYFKNKEWMLHSINIDILYIESWQIRYIFNGKNGA